MTHFPSCQPVRCLLCFLFHSCCICSMAHLELFGSCRLGLTRYHFDQLRFSSCQPGTHCLPLFHSCCMQHRSSLSCLRRSCASASIRYHFDQLHFSSYRPGRCPLCFLFHSCCICSIALILKLTAALLRLSTQFDVIRPARFSSFLQFSLPLGIFFQLFFFPFFSSLSCWRLSCTQH